MGRRKKTKSKPAMTKSRSDKKRVTNAPSDKRDRSTRFLPSAFGVGFALVILIGMAWKQWLSKPWTNPKTDLAHAASTKSGLAKSQPLTNTSSLQTKRQADLQRQVAERLNPRNDGWTSEVVSEVVNEQLDRIAGFLMHPETLTTDSLSNFVAANIRFQNLHPAALETIFNDSDVNVFRAGDSRNAATELSGAASFHDSLDKLTQQNNFKQAKFKVIRIDHNEELTTTDAFFEANGVRQGEPNRDSFQITAMVECKWKFENAQNPVLISLRCIDFEEVTARKNGSWLADCTIAVLGNSESFRNEFSVGMDGWVNRLDRRLMVSRFGHHGITIGDANGDGMDDIYVCQPGGLPNRLYIQQSDGSATDVSEEAKVDFLDYCSSSIFADLDNDNDQDLIVASAAAIVILSNDGNGKFTPRAALPDCRGTFSMCVADYDADGLLDIYACGYRKDSSQSFQLPLPVPYYDASNGGKNRLFRNMGKWKFQNVTEASGLDADNTRFSFAAAWEDYDNDGDPDLYVANDYGRNCLYENSSGKFTNVAPQLDVEDVASGMSVSWADFNQDGLMDLYVSNMYSSAGNRIAFQNSFSQKFDDETISKIKRHALGNTLYVAGQSENSKITFQDRSVEAAVTMGRWAWASLFVDINNDSREDLLVANGLMTTDDTGDL